MASSTSRSLLLGLGLLMLAPVRGHLGDGASLVQGNVKTSLLPAKASDEDISAAAARAATAAAETALAAERAAAERAAAESMASATDRSRAAEKAESLGTEGMDAATRQVKAATQKLRVAQKRVGELRARLRELRKENETALSKLNRSLTKGKMFAEKSAHAKLKEEEREGMRGKHVHLDVAKYGERIKQGNLDSYGLWTTSNEKQHYWEKTWDIVSNHIFGLDKLAKNIWNRTEYDKQVKKYAKYEKFFSAKLAAASQEAKEVEDALKEATRETEEAEAVIAGAAEAKSASAAQRKRAREELAALKAERRKLDDEDDAAKAADSKHTAMHKEEAQEEDVESDPEIMK